jgi:Zn-dependent peptidase ImmA (M78 family)
MIKIKNFKWKIEEIEDKTNIDFWNSEEDFLKLYGQCHFDKQVIYLWKDITPERRRHTLIHELTHAFLDTYIIKKEAYDEEDICNILGSYADDIIEITDLYLTSR